RGSGGTPARPPHAGVHLPGNGGRPSARAGHSCRRAGDSGKWPVTAPLERPQGALPLRPTGIHSREGGTLIELSARGRGVQARRAVWRSRRAASSDNVVGAPTGRTASPPDRDSLPGGRNIDRIVRPRTRSSGATCRLAVT